MQPVLVAFDGSDEAQFAVETASALFPERLLVVVSVWEPGLKMMLAPVDDVGGLSMGHPSPTAEQIAGMDRAMRDRAVGTAEAGVRLAREHGVSAEPRPVPDEVHIAETIAALAEQEDAAAVVIGSRGLGAVKSKLFGSTTRDLLRTTRRPVLVVKSPE